MVLVVVTDGNPIAALRRLFARIGFILFPASILLIRYTPLGRSFTPDGEPENTGVTTNKNTLGLVVFLISIGALWNLRALLIDKKAPNRSRRLVAQLALLTFGIVLMQMAHCATAIACFILGGGLMLLTTRRAIRKRPSRVYALCLVIVLAGGLGLLFGGGSALSSALGRGEGLSGRTEIWGAVIDSADNAVIGTGFESFWNVNVQRINQTLHREGYWDMSGLVSAHNGYLEVYVDLGLIGVCLIVVILISGYLRAGKAFQRDPEFAGLMLAYITTGTFYSITEAGFRTLTYSWIFLLLAVVSATGIVSGLSGGETRRNSFAPDRIPVGARAGGKPAPDNEPAFALRCGSNMHGVGDRSA